MRSHRRRILTVQLVAVVATMSAVMLQAEAMQPAQPRPAAEAPVAAPHAAPAVPAAAPDTAPAAPARAVNADHRALPRLSVAVNGNRLVDPTGEPVRLLGVNRSGTQYACVQGWGLSDGPIDNAAINAMASWHINAVRVSLNEHCWLGVNGVPAEYSGHAYRQAIVDFVNRLTAKRLYVILTLHWAAPQHLSATGKQPMADRDHAPEFWRSVASTFGSNRAVLFDLYNEPYPDSNSDSTEAWRCVRDGGYCPGVGFQGAGSQEMVDAVRSTGAANVILVGGTQHAGSLTRWLEYAPYDPLQQLAASVHIYGPNFTSCSTRSCWDNVIAPLAKRVPVVLGEIGIASSVCSPAFVQSLMEWADGHGLSYLAWSWIVGGCTTEPSLIASYSGVPTAYGAGVRAHLLRLRTLGR